MVYLLGSGVQVQGVDVDALERQIPFQEQGGQGGRGQTLGYDLKVNVLGQARAQIDDDGLLSTKGRFLEFFRPLNA